MRLCLRALEKDASTKENRQGGKMWISFVDMLFAHRIVLPWSGSRDFGATWTWMNAKGCAANLTPVWNDFGRGIQRERILAFIFEIWDKTWQDSSSVLPQTSVNRKYCRLSKYLMADSNLSLRGDKGENVKPNGDQLCKDRRRSKRI